MRKFLEVYANRIPKSIEKFEKAKKLIPGGVGSALRYFPPAPFFVKTAKGAYVWDIDGNKYLDLSMCYAAMIAGHSNDIINEAIKSQVDEGTLYGLPSPIGIELIEEIQRRYPVMEMVRFTQSGVESTMAAVRLARAVTMKTGILKVEGAYHGGADMFLVSTGVPYNEMAGPSWSPSSIVEFDGVDANAAANTHVVQFNDLESLEYQLKKFEGEIACFIIEPCMTNGGVIPPDSGYLEGVRELTRKHNVLLIFDEVKVGCRIAEGGACERYAIEPDLVTLAKAIGGGTCLGAFGGKREYMSLISPLGHVFHAGTYGHNPLSMTAGLACLKQVLTKEATERIRVLGEKYASGLEEIINTLEFPASVTHEGPLGGIQFVTEKPHTYRQANQCDKQIWDEYWIGMISKGVIPMGGAWFEEYSISVAHTDKDIEEALNITEDVLREIKNNM